MIQMVELDLFEGTRFKLTHHCAIEVGRQIGNFFWQFGQQIFFDLFKKCRGLARLSDISDIFCKMKRFKVRRKKILCLALILVFENFFNTESHEAKELVSQNFEEKVP